MLLHQKRKGIDYRQVWTSDSLCIALMALV
jgi:hypothetical protein